MDTGKDIFMMTRQEIQRYQIICKILDHEINQQEASEILRLSDRQIRRIVHRVKVSGESGVVHRLRGRRGNRGIEEELKQKVLRIYRARYKGFGPMLASEKLLERDGLKINDETLRLWLIEEALWQVKKRRVRKSLSWRERKAHVGEMVQMDGSHHAWLEDRGPKLVLMGYIDDATGRFYGKFYGYEGTVPAIDSLKSYINRYGIPKSIYLDRHSTYKVNKVEYYKDWPFRDKEELTQFGRCCHQLGIELIYANSPQAKGRIERIFETLQDRLTKELRLAQASTCQEANEVLERYLDSFNSKFEVAAKRSGNLHRQPDKRMLLDEIMSIQTQRPLRNDRTIVHNKRWYQVLTRTRAENVVVYEYLNGRMAIKHGANRLEYKSINGPLVRPKPIRSPAHFRGRRSYIPPRNSYWRIGFKLPGSLRTN
ncbi:MAG TPA: ISNCY family transposase [Candidatus Omnitrophota bacterium]|nr:ISNCY family transposase [Candidatus Omnitrophota bacterium]HQJ15150.1 ISNCY family transposase [Candidatus Omnitrophota bacterium]